MDIDSQQTSQFQGTCHNCGKKGQKASECYCTPRREYCRRVLGCHPHPSYMGKVLGMTWSRSKHVVVDEVCALNRWYGMSPACDSLDHRAEACYLPCSLHTMNFIMPLVCASLLDPPSAFWTCIKLSQSRVPSFCSKNRCTLFTNWLSCWSRNSTAKYSGWLDKVAL